MAVVLAVLLTLFVVGLVIAWAIRHYCEDYPCFNQTEQYSPDDEDGKQ